MTKIAQNKDKGNNKTGQMSKGELAEMVEISLLIAEQAKALDRMEPLEQEIHALRQRVWELELEARNDKA